MTAILQNLVSSAFIGFLFILPFMTMEIINRRNYDEPFPFVLFFGMWQIVFAISLLLLPLVRARRSGKPGTVDTGANRRSALFANPTLSAAVSAAIFLTLGVLALLDNLGWLPLQSFINGPDPEQEYLPGLFINTGIFCIIIAAAVIANIPVVRTLQAGGGLFAHSINITIVAVFVFFFAAGLASLVIDQWPCFLGVPLCD